MSTEAGQLHPLPPQPELPEAVAAFVGAWAGRWNRIVTSLGEGAQDGAITLVVENIMPATDETYQAYVIYSWGLAGRDITVRPDFYRTTGTIGQDGVLQLRPTRNGVMMTFTASVSEDRKILDAHLQSPNPISLTMSGTLWRTRLP